MLFPASDVFGSRGGYWLPTVVPTLRLTASWSYCTKEYRVKFGFVFDPWNNPLMPLSTHWQKCTICLLILNYMPLGSRAIQIATPKSKTCIPHQQHDQQVTFPMDPHTSNEKESRQYNDSLASSYHGIVWRDSSRPISSTKA